MNEKKWWLSRKGELIDLNRFDAFFVDQLFSDGPWSVSGCLLPNNPGDDWSRFNLSQFDSMKEAEDYLLDIYNRVLKND